MKTADVRLLVREVLDALPRPYSEHVIEDVFLLIESTPNWLQEYKRLNEILGKDVVNNWGGQWVGIELGKVGERQVPSKRSSLIGSYSVLDTDAKTVARKPKESEALDLMAAYYKAHREELSSHTPKYREDIVQLIMEGLPVNEAFSRAIERDA